MAENTASDGEKAVEWSAKKGVVSFSPAHPMVKGWSFTEAEEDHAALAHYMAKIAEKNGMNQNDLQHLFPAVLRMLKVDSEWSQFKTQ